MMKKFARGQARNTQLINQRKKTPLKVEIHNTFRGDAKCIIRYGAVSWLTGRKLIQSGTTCTTLILSNLC
jgi:hypothetical protein